MCWRRDLICGWVIALPSYAEAVAHTNPAVRYPQSPLSRRHRRRLWRKESSRFPTADPMDTHLLMSKDVGLLIRLEKTLRDEFVAACHANDRPAAELRDVNREGAE
jgi:hypothetical protein